LHIKASLLANTLTSLVGLITVEKGKDEASYFTSTHIIMPEILDNLLCNKDAKPKLLQYLTHTWKRPEPVYKETAVPTNAQTNQVYAINVYSGDALLATGTASKRRAAEIQAAETTLVNLWRTPHTTPHKHMPTLDKLIENPFRKLQESTQESII